MFCPLLARYRHKPSQIHHQMVQSPEHSTELFSLLHVGIFESCNQLWITGTCSHRKRVHVASSDIASSMSSLWIVYRPWYHAVVVDNVQCDDWWHVQGQSLQMTPQWGISYVSVRCSDGCPRWLLWHGVFHFVVCLQFCQSPCTWWPLILYNLGFLPHGHNSHPTTPYQ